MEFCVHQSSIINYLNEVTILFKINLNLTFKMIQITGEKKKTSNLQLNYHL